jgi:hypothetical protein
MINYYTHFLTFYEDDMLPLFYDLIFFGLYISALLMVFSRKAGEGGDASKCREKYVMILERPGKTETRGNKSETWQPPEPA